MLSGFNFISIERLMSLASDLFMCIDQNGSVKYLAGPWRKVTGYDSYDLTGKPYPGFQTLGDNGSLDEAQEDSRQVSFDGILKHKDGSFLRFDWSGFWSGEELWLVGKPVVDPEPCNQRLLEKEELYRVLVEHGSDMLALFDEEINFIYSSASTKKILGYSHDKLAGVSALSLIHPDDLHFVQEKLRQVLVCEGYTTISDFRFKNAQGEWKILETTISNQLNNPFVKALVTSSRDVTEQRTNRLLLLESEQRFKSLFEDNPDTVLAENSEGFFIDVNHAGELFIGAPKEEIIGRHISEFMPPEASAQCIVHLKEAFEGKTVNFTLETYYTGIGSKVLDITKVPVKVDGVVLAVHTVVKDVTEFTNYQRVVTQQAKRLTTIFESITDAFCMIGRDWNYTYVNSEFERLAEQCKEHYVGKHFLDIYPDSTNSIFYKKYAFAMETGQSVHFEAFSPELKLWLNVKAFPSEEGLSIYFTDVTGQINAQEELYMLSLVASHTTNGVIITDAERKIKWVNEGFTRLTGYTLEEAVGLIPSDLLQSSVPDVKTLKLVREKMSNWLPVSFEFEGRKKNGEPIWLLVQVNPIFNNDGELSRFIIVQTDITERREAQRELEKLSLVASRTDNGVVITDATGRIEWVNEGFTNITGYSKSESLGKKPGELLQGPETNRKEVRIVSEKLKGGKHFNTQLINYRKSGEKFWVSMDITPIRDETGDIIQFIAIQKDITFRREAEANMHKMTQDLYRQNTDLQQFTYIVSHNLRAPVANALGLSRLLTIMDKHSERYDQSVQHLHQSMMRLDTVLNDMNKILSIRDRKGILDHELVDISSVMNQVLESFQEELHNCGGVVENGIQVGLEVKTNKAYLYSIFHNLLSNAIKYRSDVRSLSVCVQCLAHSERGVLISFSDNGVGFDSARAAGNTFKLYKRFHTDRKGRGIGLYLVKTHLEAMGGHVEVSSQVGTGTNFLIHLPN